MAGERTADADVRIRLEGAWERLESSEQACRQLSDALASGRWRRRLMELPDLIGAALRARQALGDAEQRAEAWARSHEPTGGQVTELLARWRRAWSGLAQVAAQRSPAPRAGVETALRAIEAAVLTAIPGEPRPHERRVMEGRTGSRALLHLVWAGYPFGMLLGILGHPLAWMAVGAGAGLTFLALLLMFLGVGAGRYVLTNQRLIMRPTGSSPIQFELKDLGPDAVSVVGGGTLKVESALGEVVIPLVGEPDRLLRLLEEYRTAPEAPPP